MDLVGAWLRQLLGAGMAAAIVPVAMLAALVVVLVGAGGFGGLSSLGQIVGGPEISPTEVAAASQPSGTDKVRVAPPSILAVRRPTVSRRTPRAPGRQTTPSTRQRPQTPSSSGRIPPAVGGPGLVAPPPPAPPPPPPPSAAAKKPTSPVRDVLTRTVDDVEVVVSKVIDGLGNTVQRLLGPPPLDR